MVHWGLHDVWILPNFAPMYIKVQTRTKIGTDGKKHSSVYPRLYESYRDSDGKIRQHYPIPLDLDDLPSWKDRYGRVTGSSHTTNSDNGMVSTAYKDKYGHITGSSNSHTSESKTTTTY